jgi:hypothetical protein
MSVQSEQDLDRALRNSEKDEQNGLSWDIQSRLFYLDPKYIQGAPQGHIADTQIAFSQYVKDRGLENLSFKDQMERLRIDSRSQALKGNPARSQELSKDYVQAAGQEAQSGISTGFAQSAWDEQAAYQRIEKNMQVELAAHGGPPPAQATSDVTDYKLSDKRAAPSFNVAVKELGAALAGPQVVPPPVAPQSGVAPKR